MGYLQTNGCLEFPWKLQPRRKPMGFLPTNGCLEVAAKNPWGICRQMVVWKLQPRRKPKFEETILSILLFI